VVADRRVRDASEPAVAGGVVVPGVELVRRPVVVDVAEVGEDVRVDVGDLCGDGQALG
jgi:hypothetical protein